MPSARQDGTCKGCDDDDASDGPRAASTSSTTTAPLLSSSPSYQRQHQYRKPLLTLATVMAMAVGCVTRVEGGAAVATPKSVVYGALTPRTAPPQRRESQVVFRAPRERHQQSASLQQGRYQRGILNHHHLQQRQPTLLQQQQRHHPMLMERSGRRSVRGNALQAIFAPIESIFKAATVATVAGGALSGGLHAISGPDHLAALLPRCIGQRWWRAGRIALIWGSGHGTSTIILGMLMWSLKDRIAGEITNSFIPDLSRWTEAAVGLSLMLIGVIGLREAASWDDSELDAQTSNSTAVQSNSKFQNGAIYINGLLHGCSLDGLQTLAPALALSHWRSAMVFMIAHYLGTAISMAATTAAIGEGSLRVGKALKKPQIIRSLSRGSSIVALAVGAVFAFRAIAGIA